MAPKSWQWHLAPKRGNGTRLLAAEEELAALLRQSSPEDIAGEIAIVGALYEVETGRVRWL